WRVPMWHTEILEDRRFLSASIVSRIESDLTESLDASAVHVRRAVSPPRIVGQYKGTVTAAIPGDIPKTIALALRIKTQNRSAIRGTAVMGGVIFAIKGTIDIYSEFRLTFSSTQASGYLTGK